MESSEYVRQFGIKLNLPKEVVRDAERICKEIEKWDIFESHSPQPRTVAAAVILFYLNIPWRHPHIAEVRKSLTEIKEVAGIQADNTIIDLVKKFFPGCAKVCIFSTRLFLLAKSDRPGCGFSSFGHP